ncbi:MAG: 2-dehydropantoate 2-reductase [Elusimicrobiota bacterium]
MPEDPRWVAVVGPGAIGGTLAASLRRAGRDVVIVGRSAKNLARIRREGLLVIAPPARARRFRGWLDATPRLTRRGGCAAIFLCVKSPGARAAIRAVRAAVGEKAAVVSLMDGLAHVRPARAAFGPARAVFGSCYMAATRTGTASVLHWRSERIVLAATPRNRAAASVAAGLLRSAGWRVVAVPSEERMLWTKIVYDAAVQPLAALLGKANGELASHPAVRELVGAVLREASAAARSAGWRPLDAETCMARRILRDCLAAPRQLGPMAQDIAAGRPTEADAILRPLIMAARRKRTDSRLMEPLYHMIKRLEREVRRA